MDKYTRLNGSKLDCDRLSILKQLIIQSPEHYPMAEVGVYKGGTLRVIAESDPDKMVIGFDTFSGLPQELWNKDEPHKPREFNDTSYEYVAQQLNDLYNVTLIKGIFPQSAHGVYADLRYSFVHIDVDYYQSVFESIVFFVPRMAKNGIILFDDYGWKQCPGVEKAIGDYGLSVTVVDHDYIKQAYWINI